MRARQEQAVSSLPVVLRPYQKQVITDVYELIRQQIKRILIFAPTGAGKTLIASQIMAHAVIRARKVIFVVHRDILVSQTSDKLTRFGLSECCGYVKSGWKENKDAPVQIASVQTLAKRDWWQKIEANVILLDECHLTAFADVIKKMMTEIFPNAMVESRGATTLRPSLLEPDVRLSPHTAPDVLSFRFVRVDVRITTTHLSFRTGRAAFTASGS